MMQKSRLRPGVLPLTLALAFLAAGGARAQERQAPNQPLIPDNVELESFDLGRIWQAIRPAIREGRRPELIEQLAAVFTDPDAANPMGGGWYHDSQTRYAWDWLSHRFDGDGDGSVSREEFDAAHRQRAWKSLDRDGNGKVTAEDFDWSNKSPWVRQMRAALNRFAEIDSDANGKVTRAEWTKYFATVSHGKDQVTVEDLRDSMALRPERSRSLVFPFRYRWNRAKVILNGDIGSMFEGPSLNAEAPEFILPLQDGSRFQTLGEFRGQKPVILIFGSFT